MGAMVAALKSFSGSSSGGVDGLRPGHIKDLISAHTAEAGEHLKISITALINSLLRAEIPQHARDLIFSANLTALKRKDGGIRPIAVGNIFRRLAAKIACRVVMKETGHELRPVQLGVGIQGGCEAAVHATRSFFENTSHAPPRILLKLDMKNAFNSIRRDHALEVCHQRTPSIFKLAHLSYSHPSMLIASHNIISSATVIQQGDPLGPLLFAMAIDGVARSIASLFNIWYLDDATLGGPIEAVAADLRRVIPALSLLELEINSSKSEIINLNYTADDFDGWCYLRILDSRMRKLK
ncbi:unnamed protein product [Acanthosepion pharaonis]|uniref:Reverse transcriptase domain-containing protein n=1 Tax=Acanthosepion pharaonis TaxID=158019 RepID=A0A812CFU2_ACAPH|nr:unnamed protein product [Sepia pharaonis]